MPKLTIDGMEIEVEPGLTVLQACEQVGIEIPRFCYHERLSIAGNCRMCLVEMERAPKPVASCAMPVGEGMVIKTNTEAVQKMRQGVMEFLLINHPLDCPICDQGGECDLQDQAMSYGCDRSRYAEVKRAVPNKDFGPLVKGVMTRCIHCTRCVRFITEVAGVPDMGGIGRGEHMEISTYVEKALSSELSGNVVDLCPVGALTSRPYAFTARPWELRRTETVDVLDAVGSNIRVDARGPEVLRVLPRNNDDINEEWLGDKNRHACDGLTKRRLDRPYVRGADGKLAPASWDDALAAVADKVSGLDGSKIAAIAGDLVDCESTYALKGLMAALRSPNMDCRQDGAALDTSIRAGYLFNSTIAGIEEADAILLVGTNPRREAAVLNARIRKRYMAGGLSVGVIGEETDLTYKTEYLGSDASLLSKLSGRNPFGKILKDAEKPMIVLGMGALARPDGAAILAAARDLADKMGMIKDGWNGFNVLHTAGGRVGALDLGFLPGDGGRDIGAILDGAKKGDIEVVFLHGADEIDMSRLGKAFVVYQGHHGDAGAARADVILPGAAYTEKEGTYVNTEGRAQRARRAVFPPGEAKEDWAILRALSGALDKALPFDDLPALRKAMIADHPTTGAIDAVSAAEWGAFGTAGDIASAPLVSPVDDYYRTDPISRASETMARCSEVFGSANLERTGTNG
ncbi:NADH-quinone oxidoreductase subunit NuoG [Magnetospira sp. QH-2]|uniref:NADH-quinone oxidoreductase subunit NuoG n=1 Tax=Magnetospira sp. (strain QH-2) TaxID=1288970 RepID=UPI0003E81615|nr:NADH-quinone oxidoreductase subunit NuoG [Magnetospira sp. QH-2]CCQ73871.1 NADH-quinone oxidoreductase chain G (NADH dehydrogenase I, chain G) (NDH-1, chain G) [Magnetospira sp. QH-2]